MGYVQCVHRTFDFAFVNHTINICCSFDRPIFNDYELRISFVCLVCMVYGCMGATQKSLTITVWILIEGKHYEMITKRVIEMIGLFLKN